MVYLKLSINSIRFNARRTWKYLLFETLSLLHISKKHYWLIFLLYLQQYQYAHHYSKCVIWTNALFSISSPVTGRTMQPLYPRWLFAVRHNMSRASVVYTSEGKWNVYLAVIRPFLLAAWKPSGGKGAEMLTTCWSAESIYSRQLHTEEGADAAASQMKNKTKNWWLLWIFLLAAGCRRLDSLLWINIKKRVADETTGGRRSEWEPLQVLRGSSDGKRDEEGGGGEEAYWIGKVAFPPASSVSALVFPAQKFISSIWALSELL